MKPFLLLTTRPEDDVARAEAASFQRFSGLGHDDLRWVRIEREDAPAIRAEEISGIYLGNCQQDKKAAGGPGSIAEQLAESNVDLILGGGAKHFDAKAEGDSVSVRRLAEKNGFTVVTTPEQLAERAAVRSCLRSLSVVPPQMPCCSRICTA